MANTTHSVTANGNYPNDTGMLILRPVTIVVSDPGAATVKVQIKAGSGWVDVGPVSSSFTDAPGQNLDLVGANGTDNPQLIRFNVTGYSAPFEIVVM